MNESPPRNSRTVLILAIIAIVLIVLTGAVAAFIILDRSGDTAEAAASSTTTVTVGTSPDPASQNPAPPAVVPASRNPSFQSADGAVVCEIGTQPAGTWGGSPDRPAVACLAFDYSGPGVQVAPCPSKLPTRQGGVAITPAGTWSAHCVPVANRGEIIRPTTSRSLLRAR